MSPNNKKLVKFDHMCPYDECDKIFNRPSRLETHIRIHTGERPYVCDIDGCNKTYTRSTHLKRHKQVFDHCKLFKPNDCNGIDTTPYSSGSDSEKKPRRRRKNMIKCPEPGCSEVFNKQRKLTAHKAEHPHFVYPCICIHEGCGKGFLFLSKLKKHMKVHQGYRCTKEDCEEVFATWSLYRRHYSSTHKMKTLVCAECKKTFTHQSALSRHVRVHSDTRNMLECPRDDCDRRYVDLRSLRQHILSQHEGRRFACGYDGCDKKFVAKCSLNTHELTHLNPKPPECQKKKKIRNQHKRRKMACAVSGYDPAMAPGTVVPLVTTETSYESDTADILLPDNVDKRPNVPENSSLFVHIRDDARYDVDGRDGESENGVPSTIANKDDLITEQMEHIDIKLGDNCDDGHIPPSIGERTDCNKETISLSDNVNNNISRCIS